LTGYTPTKWYHFSLRSITIVLVPLCSLIGICGGFVLASNNGTFAAFTELRQQEKALFPGTQEPLLSTYIGLPTIDRLLTSLVAFFAHVVDGSDGALMLMAIDGLAQFGAMWTLLVMESMRAGNKGKAASFITVTGIFCQVFSANNTVPLYLLLHLLTSPVAKAFPGSYANSVLLISPWDLRILPISISLGYVVPTIAMALPFPSKLSNVTHQHLIALWQAFPIWTTIIHITLRSCCTFARDKLVRKTSEMPSIALGTSYLNEAGHVYRFILMLCMITHIPIMLVTLIPSWVYPESAQRIIALSQNGFFDVYLSGFPRFDYQIPSLAAGVHRFLQWDLYGSAGACLVWAVYLYQNATVEKKIVDPNTGLPKYGELMSGETVRRHTVFRKLFFKIILWTIVAGPMGATTVLLWDRDAIVRQKTKQGI